MVYSVFKITLLIFVTMITVLQAFKPHTFRVIHAQGDSFYLAHTFAMSQLLVCVISRYNFQKSFRELWIIFYSSLTKDNHKNTFRHFQERFVNVFKNTAKSTKIWKSEKLFFGLFNFLLCDIQIFCCFFLCSEKFLPYYRTGYNQFPMQIKNNHKSFKDNIH